MITILLQKILDLLRENLANMIKFFVTDPQDGQTLVYDAESEEWKNDYVEIELQDTASGAVATFETEAVLPLVSLKANITATQSGSGTPSPSNPRPISGFSSVTLTQKDSEDNTVDTFTIALGDTYYGGVLDCKNGTATITHAIIDMGDITWVYDSTYTRFNSQIAGILPKMQARTGNILCSCYQTISDGRPVGNVPNLSIYQGTSRDISVVDNDYTDAPTFTTSVSGQKIRYELATPITLTGLTADNFTTIVGQNNIFADSGDVEVIYNTTSAQKVWDVANLVEDITDTITINTTCVQEATADIKVYKQGHVVYLYCNYMHFTAAPEDTGVIISGLPKPDSKVTSFMYNISKPAMERLRVNEDGELQMWYSRPYANQDVTGQYVYISSED